MVVQRETDWIVFRQIFLLDRAQFSMIFKKGRWAVRFIIRTIRREASRCS